MVNLDILKAKIYPVFLSGDLQSCWIDNSGNIGQYVRNRTLSILNKSYTHQK